MTAFRFSFDCRSAAPLFRAFTSRITLSACHTATECFVHTGNLFCHRVQKLKPQFILPYAVKRHTVKKQNRLSVLLCIVDIGTPSCTKGGCPTGTLCSGTFVFKGGGPQNVFDIITRMCSVRSRAHMSLYC